MKLDPIFVNWLKSGSLEAEQAIALMDECYKQGDRHRLALRIAEIAFTAASSAAAPVDILPFLLR